MLPLTTREIYQLLRDAALEVRPMRLIDELGESGLVHVDIEGWRLTLEVDGTHLRHCQHCRSPDGREQGHDSWQRYGTDSVSLLSTWELAQIERLLGEFRSAV